MASRKDLKKDIEYLVFDLIADCYQFINDNPDKDFSGYEQIINDIIDIHDSLLTRINQFDPKGGESSRKYFHRVKIDLAEGLKKGYTSLEELVK